MTKIIIINVYNTKLVKYTLWLKISVIKTKNEDSE